LLKNLKIKGSEDNSVFLDYQLFMIENQTKSSQLSQQLKRHLLPDSVKKTLKKKQLDMHEDSVKILRAQLKELDSLVKEKWNSIKRYHPQSLLASILNVLTDITVPDPPKDANGKILDSTFQYRYYKEHFFDNTDFSDYRLLRTPVLEAKIDEYLEKTILQIPDSIIVGVDKVVGLAKAHPKVYRYAIQYVFNKYNNPKIMCMDRVFVHVSDKYYLSGEADWALKDTAFMKKLKERVDKERPNRCGEIAPDLRLVSLTNQLVSISSIKADYIVIYFFEPSCGHCQKIIPQWNKIYNENKFAEKNVKSVLIYTQVDTKEWKDFIDKHQLQGHINLYDPFQNTRFRDLYDIYSTPVPYVIDGSTGKIVAKRIGPDIIADFINNMLELKKKKK
ncbi:MAG: DUF5106 domain-containing protein, partial [Endomicrobiia bacterium]